MENSNLWSIKLYREDERVMIPTYSTEGAAGMDLKVWRFESTPGDKFPTVGSDITEEGCMLMPGSTVICHTGLHMAIPENLHLKIVSRSGMACKKGIIVANSPGIIDSDYRGEIMIVLRNLSQKAVFIENNERVAQGILERHELPIWDHVSSIEELGTTTRGSGGFGSTGKV